MGAARAQAPRNRCHDRGSRSISGSGKRSRDYRRIDERARYRSQGTRAPPSSRPTSQVALMPHRLAPEAELDLDELWFYVASDSSVETADRLIDTLTARFVLLAAHPHAGRQRDDLLPGIRSFPVGTYVVLYRVAGETVLIERVVRGSRDLEGLFDE